MSYGYRTYRQPDCKVMFAVRYDDGTSAYFRVPKTVGAFGVTPAVVRLAHEALRAETRVNPRAGVERLFERRGVWLSLQPGL
jgi:hypothetical protein